MSETPPLPSRWAIRVDTPLGTQAGLLHLRPAGDGFEGEVTGDLGAVPVERGRIAGARLSWTLRVTSPMPLTLECEVEVTGDTLAGTVAAGFLGRYPVTGKRAG